MAAKRGRNLVKGRPGAAPVQDGPVKVGTMPEGAVSRMIAQSTVMGRLDRQRQALDEAQLEYEVLILEARRLGLSWAAIGEATGVDRETLRRRFGVPGPRRAG